MLSRSSRGVISLRSRRLFPIYHKSPLSSSICCRDVFVRSQSTANNSSDESLINPPPYRRKPTHRNRSRKRNESQRIELGVSALGKPGEVVVVRERKRRQLRTSSAQRDEPKDESGLPFLLGELEQESAPFDNAGVIKRIESFREVHPPGERLTIADWEDLRIALRSSFTVRQLAEYFSGDIFRDLGMELPVRCERTRAEEWRPGTSVFLETGPVLQEGVADRVATSQDLKGKDLLAERILRDCWQLEVFNEIGQLDIRLPTHLLSLLLGSEHFSFEELASLHEAKIDVTHSLGLIRVTGKQRPCESIREIIHDTMNRIRDEEIVLSLPADPRGKDIGKILSPNFLSWVSKVYRVTFEQSSSYGPSRIFYLLENKPDADNARRTLNMAINHVASPPVPFGTYMSSSALFSIQNTELESSGSWLDRQKLWFRWGVSPARSDETKYLDKSIFNKHENRLSDELLKLLRQCSPSSTTLENIPGAHESVTAAVGKCLFLRKPSLEEHSVSASELGKMSVPRTFVTDIPRAAYFLRMLTPQFREDNRQFHRLRLVPSALHANLFPQLELEVAVNAGELNGTGVDCVITGATAVLIESNVDYLLPEAALDLRFTRKLTYDLLAGPGGNPSLESLQSDLRERFSRSMTSVAEVPLPTFASLTLPNNLLKQNKDLDGHTTGEYMFLPVKDIQGTRVHQYNFQDRQLYYSFYEGGPFSPQMGTDLFLEMDIDEYTSTPSISDAEPRNGASPGPLQRNFNSFYNTACALAFDADST